MKKLTKAERHEIYKRAFNDMDEDTIDCLCWAILIQICPDFINSSFKKVASVKGSPFEGIEIDHNEHGCMSKAIGELFPEFYLFNPEEDMPYWFNDLEERQTALLFCIEMTRPV
jgi:hypothetical protein